MNAALCFDNFLVLDKNFYSRPGQENWARWGKVLRRWCFDIIACLGVVIMFEFDCHYLNQCLRNKFSSTINVLSTSLPPRN